MPTPAGADWSGFNLVDGDFAGTTDQLIQWAACKWGIDEDIVRAPADQRVRLVSVGPAR